MRGIRGNSLLLLIVVICLFAALLGCGKGLEKKAAKKDEKGPAATAKQTIRTPVLAAKPEIEAPPPPEEEKPEKEEAAYIKPKGPITLPPSAEKPKRKGEEKEKSISETTPLATIEGKEFKPTPKAKGKDEKVKALAAPSVAPAEGTIPEEAQPIPYKPKVVTAKTNIDVIVDASGSMSAPFGATSQSKYDMLRESLYDIIYEVLQQQADFPRNLAIRTFGTKWPASDNNCEDTELIAPMGEPDLGKIRKLLDATKAQGTSPIALSLSKAPGDFPAGGKADRVIVLVADGADNCGQDPCETVRKIEAGARKYVVHVVAFDVNPLDQEKLGCISKEGSGKFFFARNKNELRTSLNEAINSTVPYNLKLSAMAGATPLPFNMTVFKAGTQRVVKRDKSFGTKLLSLDPGTYDILIEYSESPELKKPSKILKGVEILATTRVEQTVNFDLAQLQLSAINNEGKLVPSVFEVRRLTEGGTPMTPVQVQTGIDAKSVFLTPGTYTITGNLAEATPEPFTLFEKDIKLSSGMMTDRVFRFQKGTLSLKAITTQKTQIPFIFQAYRTGKVDVPIASGAFPKSGGSVQLAPGTYDLLAIGSDPEMMASPRTKVTGVEIKAADKKDVTINFEMGELKLAAIDGKDNKLPAEFVVRDHETQLEMAKVKSESGSEVKIPIPPGTYDIVATSLKSTLEPRPSVPVTGVVVAPDKPAEKIIKFVLGTLRLRGRDSKEKPIITQFTMYKAGSDKLVSGAPATTDWVVFDLAPGSYDALAINTASTQEPKPMIWLRDLKIEDGKAISHESIFTTGKLKIMGRGPNNKLIICKFKVFQYGADRELIYGVTGEDWEIFEIEPGKYYLEASYVDNINNVVLKKWINISIGDNEVVEQIIRF